MGTKPAFSRYRLFLGCIGGCTLLAAVLRTLALCLDLQIDIGYFRAGAVLPTLLYVWEGLTLLACLAPLFLIKKDELAPVRGVTSSLTLIGAILAALTFAATAIYLATQMGAIASAFPMPLALLLLAVIFLLIGGAYFLLQAMGRLESAGLCGYGVILAAALLLSVTYFDRYTPMNAPHKVALHVCLLSIMVYMLYELRVLIGRSLPRALCVISAVTFFLTATVGISNLIAFGAGIYSDPLYLMGDLCCIAMAVYIAGRAVTDLMLLSPAVQEMLTASVPVTETVPTEALSEQEEQ
ncbi:MAG: hypothetical protein IJY50_02545 [Clostridia bacterium]|nr:hypothetical protein [Clostridia bacterium]